MVGVDQFCLGSIYSFYGHIDPPPWSFLSFYAPGVSQNLPYSDGWMVGGDQFCLGSRRSNMVSTQLAGKPPQINLSISTFKSHITVLFCTVDYLGSTQLAGISPEIL